MVNLIDQKELWNPGKCFVANVENKSRQNNIIYLIYCIEQKFP